MTKKLFDYFVKSIDHNAVGSYILTKREKQIVELLIKGLTYQQVADNSFIAIDTLNSHIRNIYSKLGVHSKSELFARLRPKY